MRDVVSGDNYSYKTCKDPVKSSPSTNQHPTFYRPDVLPVAQPTMSRHWRESIGLCYFQHFTYIFRQTRPSVSVVPSRSESFRFWTFLHFLTINTHTHTHTKVSAKVSLWAMSDGSSEICCRVTTHITYRQTYQMDHIRTAHT